MTRPFTLITEPTAVQRILLQEGLIDVANNIVGDGFVFVQIESPEYWGLVITHKDTDGTVSHRICICRKSVGAKLMAERFAAVMEHLAHGINCPIQVKLEHANRN